MARSYRKKRGCKEADAALPTALRVLTVRARPGQRSKGLLRAGPLVFPCALGRGGISAAKREGDGATPLAAMRVLGGYFRADHFAAARRTRLAMAPIDADLGWCEVPDDRNYNRPVRLSADSSADRLARADHLYDFIIEIDHNARPRVTRRGSAVFLHLARPGFGPTAGCVAMTKGAMLRLLARIGPKTKIVIG